MEEQEYSINKCHNAGGLTQEVYWSRTRVRGFGWQDPADAHCAQFLLGPFNLGPLIICQVPEGRPWLPLTTACLNVNGPEQALTH